MRRLFLGLVAAVLMALAAQQTFAQLSLPAGIAQLAPVTSAPTSCAPYRTFAAAPYQTFAAPPYRTGC